MAETTSCNASDQRFLKLFNDQSLSWLSGKGYEITDLATWQWILTAQSADRGVMSRINEALIAAEESLFQRSYYFYFFVEEISMLVVFDSFLKLPRSYFLISQSVSKGELQLGNLCTQEFLEALS